MDTIQVSTPFICRAPEKDIDFYLGKEGEPSPRRALGFIRFWTSRRLPRH